MLFSQTVGIANIVLPAPIVMFHVKLWLGRGEEGGGGGDRRCCGMGVGSTVELSFVTLAQCFSSLAHPCNIMVLSYDF